MGAERLEFQRLPAEKVVQLRSEIGVHWPFCGHWPNLVAERLDINLNGGTC
jgi:hypothetical protein